MILIDTKVILDILVDDEARKAWSLDQLDRAGLNETLLINGVIYAELSIGFETQGQLDEAIARFEFFVAEVPRAALFVAAKAYQRYRRQGGTGTNVLPDFFVDAHAATVGIPLLTRDSRRYRVFSQIELIAPNLPGD